MQAVLVMIRSDGEKRSFSISREMTVIGRRQDCDLMIPLGEISRKHCRIIKEADSLRLEDLGSSNGTFHNGRRVQEAMLSPGDSVQVGPISFVVQIDGVPAEDDITGVVHPVAASAADESGGYIDDDQPSVALDPQIDAPAEEDNLEVLPEDANQGLQIDDTPLEEPPVASEEDLMVLDEPIAPAEELMDIAEPGNPPPAADPIPAPTIEENAEPEPIAIDEPLVMDEPLAIEPEPADSLSLEVIEEPAAQPASEVTEPEPLAQSHEDSLTLAEEPLSIEEPLEIAVESEQYGTLDQDSPPAVEGQPQNGDEILLAEDQPAPAAGEESYELALDGEPLAVAEEGAMLTEDQLLDLAADPGEPPLEMLEEDTDTLPPGNNAPRH